MKIGANNASPSGPGVRGWTKGALEEEAMALGLVDDREEAKQASRSWLASIVEQELIHKGELNQDGTWNEDLEEHEFGDF